MKENEKNLREGTGNPMVNRKKRDKPLLLFERPGRIVYQEIGKPNYLIKVKFKSNQVIYTRFIFSTK